MPAKVKSTAKKAIKKSVKKAVKAIKKVAKKAPVKKAVKPALKKVAKAASIKKPIKKAIKAISKVAKKAPVKKATKPALKKVASIVKPKKAIRSITKAKTVRVAKPSPIAKVKATPKVVRPGISKEKAKLQEKPLQSKRPHGRDMHFIPSHHQEVPLTIHNSNTEEKLFHHDEEVAIHQESEKVKTSLATRSGKKRTFQTRSGF